MAICLASGVKAKCYSNEHVYCNQNEKALNDGIDSKQSKISTSSTTTTTTVPNNVPSSQSNTTSKDAENSLRQGMSLFEKDDYKNAIPHLEKAAKMNNTYAQGLLGECYRQIWESEKAKYWLEKSANQGDAVGEYYLGLYYYQGTDILGTTIDYGKARYWFTRAASHQNEVSPLAQTELGNIYSEGKGVAKNLQKAKEWYQKAADQGFVVAQARIGDVYYEENNVQKAKYWYEKAANQGHDGAQCVLGVIYSEERNMQKAIYWLEKAGNHGNEYAIDLLVDIYKTGDGIPKDLQKATYWSNKRKGIKSPGLNLVKEVYESVINKDKQ